MADDSVIAILVGHLHDSHKEIYQRPFSWSTVNDPRNGFDKLYLAPPVSVKNQDTSPIQARGFAVVSLDSDQIDYRIYWYNAEASSFTPAREPAFEAHNQHAPSGHWGQAILWFWRLGDPQKPLDRMAVLLIALLAAFLTVVQIWQIPAPENPMLAQPPATGAQTENTGGTQAGRAQTSTRPTFDPSPFASNFGKTIITGLGGLAASVVVKSFDGSSNPADNKFYIVWFILSFVALLIAGALLRAIEEAIRERIAINHLKPARPPIQPDATRLERFASWTVYQVSCLWVWVLSLRFSVLIFLDTFINLIQGKNQTMTRVFSDTIVKQHRNVICVTEVMRQQLNDLILQYLSKMPHGEQRETRDVRVNISVLSEDETGVFYIARTPGSSPRTFPKHSVVWISVFTGKIRWYKHAYIEHEKYKEIELFDNASGKIPGGEVKIMLSNYYQQREDDYNAFVIFPIPWPQRAYGSGCVRGAIHISFRKLGDFEQIWKIRHADAETDSKDLEIDQVLGELKNMHYTSEEKMLEEWCAPEIKTSLNQSITILSQLLSGFSENIYKYSKRQDDCN
ncbi:MAG: hypothetical protein P4L50_26450 [Anaerolineaceae bacterium]|nr:hypothetical protein [Anaerolineaceae bacterium]